MKLTVRISLSIRNITFDLSYCRWIIAKKKQFPYMNNNLDCYLRISTGTIKRYTSNKTAFSILCVKITHIYYRIRCKTLYMWVVGYYTMICTKDKQNLISADDILMNVRCKDLMSFFIVPFVQINQNDKFDRFIFRFIFKF